MIMHGYHVIDLIALHPNTQTLRHPDTQTPAADTWVYALESFVSFQFRFVSFRFREKRCTKRAGTWSLMSVMVGHGREWSLVVVNGREWSLMVVNGR